MKKLFVLLIISLSLLSFSAIVYDSDVAPIPSEWLNGYNETFKIDVNFFPWIAFGNWDSNFVTKYPWGWGKPTNPAENNFYLFNEIPPLMSFTFEFSKNGFTLFSKVDIQKEPITRTKEFENNLFIQPFDINTLSFDMNFPELFYVYYANQNLFLSIGRFPIKWGAAKYPITISDTTFQDNITFSTKIDNFRYTYHIISSYSLLSPEEQYIQSNYSDRHNPGLYFDAPYKTIIAHRFDFEFNKLRIGIGDLNVVGGKFPDLIDLNPLMFFHNTYGEGYSNVMASVDFTYKFNSNITFYGEFSMDDFEVPTTEAGSNYKPTSYGYNLGGKYKNDNFDFYIEYDHTSEWMYITNYLPYLRINVRHFYLDNLTSPKRSLMDFPLGFIYGPDATMVSVGINFNQKELKINFEYNLLFKGTVIDDGIQRWKWFWDSWYGNVTPDATYEVVDSEDVMYNIININISYMQFSLKVKTINFDNFLIGAYYEF
ncbi:MAG: hypothetical protein H0Z24_04930 [Thermosipho sp. (in: Bacteria)]|nr:hypothetical protein [Thermosipho sp. (in: thermotogales)]